MRWVGRLRGTEAGSGREWKVKASLECSPGDRRGCVRGIRERERERERASERASKREVLHLGGCRPTVVKIGIDIL